ncbi:MAG: hypothetical protein ACI4AM_01730 [Muribaculaceae bacterium]
MSRIYVLNERAVPGQDKKIFGMLKLWRNDNIVTAAKIRNKVSKIGVFLAKMADLGGYVAENS